MTGFAHQNLTECAKAVCPALSQTSRVSRRSVRGVYGGGHGRIRASPRRCRFPCPPEPAQTQTHASLGAAAPRWVQRGCRVFFGSSLGAGKFANRVVTRHPPPAAITVLVPSRRRRCNQNCSLSIGNAVGHDAFLTMPRAGPTVLGGLLNTGQPPTCSLFLPTTRHCPVTPYHSILPLSPLCRQPPCHPTRSQLPATWTRTPRRSGTVGAGTGPISESTSWADPGKRCTLPSPTMNRLTISTEG